MKAWYRVVAEIFLQAEYSEDVVRYFRRELLGVLHVAIDLGRNGGQVSVSEGEHIRNCVILAKIIKLHPDVKRFVCLL